MFSEIQVIARKRNSHGRWKHVRHTSGTSWYQATDRLKGSEVYGDADSEDE